MDEPEIKIIDVFICKLRKKLGSASNGKNYIETVWGRGYILREPSVGRGENVCLRFQRGRLWLALMRTCRARTKRKVVCEPTSPLRIRLQFQ